MLPSSPPRRWPVLSQRTFVPALLALFAVVSVQYTLKALDTRNGRQDRSAILRYGGGFASQNNVEPRRHGGHARRALRHQ